MSDPASIPSADELRWLCDFVYRRTGLVFGESKRLYVERRLAERMRHAGAPSVAAYLRQSLAMPAEAVALVNSFTINETYFYREAYQLRCLGTALLPDIVAGRVPGALVRIWSVPCATGEEPYSIALWLLENWGLVDAYNIEIVGSDVDTEALAAAAVGQFGARALERLPAEVVDRYFEPLRGGLRRIIQDIRESVTLIQANLIETESMAAQGRFDVIFCRNVLMYFDNAARTRAAANLFAALAPGGFVCLGHTESMARISDLFRPRQFEDAIVYQRPFL